MACDEKEGCLRRHEGALWWALVSIHLSYHYHTINPCNLTFVDKLLIKNLLLQKPMDKPHLQISRTLNLAAQILKKIFLERNQKKSKVKS